MEFLLTKHCHKFYLLDNYVIDFFKVGYSYRNYLKFFSEYLAEKLGIRL